MAQAAKKTVIVIGSGQSARLVARRLFSAAPDDLDLTILGPRGDRTSAESRGTLCRSIAETPDAVVARLADGRSIAADAAVLATGCASFGSGSAALASSKRLPREQGISADEPIVLAGTGTRAIRYALAVVADGHRGPLLFVGRHELATAVAHGRSLDLSPADLPLGTGLRFVLRWFRRTASWAAARGIAVSELVNGLRPHVPLIWQHLMTEERRRFVVHLRPIWLRSLETLTAAERDGLEHLLRSGQARHIRGRCLSVNGAAGQVEVRVKRLPSGIIETLQAGLALSFEDVPPGRAHFSGAVADLVARGLARPDDIEFGLDVTDDCAVIDANGRASGRIFAVGAPTRGRFVDAMEIDCIRAQSERVARRIFNNHFHRLN